MIDFNWISINALPAIILIITGVIITLIAELILEILPFTSNLKFKMKFWKKKLVKYLKKEQIDTILNIKTQDLSNKKLNPFEYKNKFKKTLNEKKITPYEKGNDLKFDFSIGRTEISAVLTFAYNEINENEEDEIIISQIEVILSAKCKFKNFDGHIIELLTGRDLIEEVLRASIIEANLNYSLICKIKNLYELTGVLSKSNLDYLIAKNKDYQIEMSSNQVIAYGQINQNLISVMKDLIIIYN